MILSDRANEPSYLINSHFMTLLVLSNLLKKNTERPDLWVITFFKMLRNFPIVNGSYTFILKPFKGYFA